MTTHALGPFRLDTQDDLLFRGSQPVGLGRRAIALLRALVDQPGVVVSKDNLIEAAWPNQAVEESNLTVQIASLRRVLGEAPGGERWIETVPRRGYRYIGPVVVTGEDVAAHALQEPEAAQPGEPERRQITIMSCELIGMPRRAHGVGLDDLQDALAAFQRCTSEVVAGRDGSVATHLGNTVIALFGYPAAHERDAEQAVSAGLELCAAVRTHSVGVGVPMRCRIGLATGMVLIAERGRDGTDRDFDIVGDTPDVAARLQIWAQPDTVAIDQTTRSLIGNLFDCRDLGAIDQTGGAGPMRVWQLLG